MSTKIIVSPFQECLEGLLKIDSVSLGSVIGFYEKFYECITLLSTSNYILQKAEFELLIKYCFQYVESIQHLIGNSSTLPQKRIQTLVATISIFSKSFTLFEQREDYINDIVKWMLEKVVTPDVNHFIAKKLLQEFNLLFTEKYQYQCSLFIDENATILYKLANRLCNSLDYDFQFCILKTIFVMCSDIQIKKYAFFLFPASTQFAKSFLTVRRTHFISDVRDLLNSINCESKNIISVMCEVFVDNIKLVGPKGENGVTLPVYADFNVNLSNITIICNKNSLKTMEFWDAYIHQCDSCVTVSVDIGNISDIHIVRNRKADLNQLLGSTIQLHLNDYCSLLYTSFVYSIDAQVLRINIPNSIELMELQTKIIPAMFNKSCQIYYDGNVSTANRSATRVGIAQLGVQDVSSTSDALGRMLEPHKMVPNRKSRRIQCLNGFKKSALTTKSSSFSKTEEINNSFINDSIANTTNITTHSTDTLGMTDVLYADSNSRDVDLDFLNNELCLSINLHNSVSENLSISIDKSSSNLENMKKHVKLSMARFNNSNHQNVCDISCSSTIKNSNLLLACNDPKQNQFDEVLLCKLIDKHSTNINVEEISTGSKKQNNLIEYSTSTDTISIHSSGDEYKDSMTTQKNCFLENNDPETYSSVGSDNNTNDSNCTENNIYSSNIKDVNTVPIESSNNQYKVRPLLEDLPNSNNCARIRIFESVNILNCVTKRDDNENFDSVSRAWNPVVKVDRVDLHKLCKSFKLKKKQCGKFKTAITSAHAIVDQSYNTNILPYSKVCVKSGVSHPVLIRNKEPRKLHETKQTPVILLNKLPTTQCVNEIAVNNEKTILNKFKDPLGKNVTLNTPKDNVAENFEDILSPHTQQADLTSVEKENDKGTSRNSLFNNCNAQCSKSNTNEAQASKFIALQKKGTCLKKNLVNEDVGSNVLQDKGCKAKKYKACTRKLYNPENLSYLEEHISWSGNNYNFQHIQTKLSDDQQKKMFTPKNNAVVNLDKIPYEYSINKPRSMSKRNNIALEDLCGAHNSLVVKNTPVNLESQKTLTETLIKTTQKDAVTSVTNRAEDRSISTNVLNSSVFISSNKTKEKKKPNEQFIISSSLKPHQSGNKVVSLNFKETSTKQKLHLFLENLQVWCNTAYSTQYYKKVRRKLSNQVKRANTYHGNSKLKKITDKEKFKSSGLMMLKNKSECFIDNIVKVVSSNLSKEVQGEVGPKKSNDKVDATGALNPINVCTTKALGLNRITPNKKINTLSELIVNKATYNAASSCDSADGIPKEVQSNEDNTNILNSVTNQTLSQLHRLLHLHEQDHDNPDVLFQKNYKVLKDIAELLKKY